jgi:primosomal protein N' (replication factor Y)
MRCAERTQEWERLQRGDAVLAIGVRSAIFAPVRKLGIVVVDEEHDSSFKQEEKFRYHARDLAVVRGQQTGCPVVLGSATPSLESLQNVHLGRYRLLQLLQRVENRPMPVVRMVDMRLTTSQHIGAAFPQLAAKIKLRAAESAVHYQITSASPVTVDPVFEPTAPATMLAALAPLDPDEGSLKISTELTQSSPLISAELAQAIDKVLHKGKQAILFLNRRGQSTYHFCLACGQALSCRRCAVSLTWHRSLGSLLCHYCGYREPLPQWCPSCAGPIESLGMGTERVETELQKVFPEARIARLDRDSATRSDQIETLLSRFGRGEQDILVGTQMVAKGHDFPGVTLVGVLLADASLNLPDFRAAERTFQLLAQVAGRAGRGQEAGEVIVQTFNPQADAVACVVGHDYSTFAEREMKLRKAYYYPPFCRLLAVRIDSKFPQQTGETAVKLVQTVAPLLKSSSGKLRLLGPAPAPISRLKGKTRWQFLVKGPTSRSLVPIAQVLEEVSRTFSRTIKISVDVDPLSLL